MNRIGCCLFSSFYSSGQKNFNPGANLAAETTGKFANFYVNKQFTYHCKKKQVDVVLLLKTRRHAAS